MNYTKIYSVFIHQEDDLYKQTQIKGKDKAFEYVNKNSEGKRFIIVENNNIIEGFNG